MNPSLHQQPLHTRLDAPTSTAVAAALIPCLRRPAAHRAATFVDADAMELVQRVRFTDLPSMDASLPSPLDVLLRENEADDFAALWYRHDEIKVFRDEARELCLQMRRILEAERANHTSAASIAAPLGLSQSSPSISSHACSSPPSSPSPFTASSTRSRRRGHSHSPVSSPRTPLLARNDRTRGLERRACPERHRRTYLSTSMILRGAQKFHSQPDTLAALARKCTAWATVLAVHEGQCDAHRAQYDDATVGDDVPSLGANHESTAWHMRHIVPPLEHGASASAIATVSVPPISSSTLSPSKRMRFRSSGSNTATTNRPSGNGAVVRD